MDDIQDYSISENFSIEMLASEYYDFLYELYEHIKLSANANSYLWFDRCTWTKFIEFAESVSTGPPASYT